MFQYNVRVYVLGILTLFCGYTSDGKASEAPKKIGRLQQFKDGFLDFCFLEELGYTEVSPENEQFIRDIQKEIGLENQRIRIKRMSKLATRLFGRENAFATLGNNLFISEDWFNTLSQEEKRFLVGHELAHLKKRHPLKMYGINIGRLLLSICIAEALKKRLSSTGLIPNMLREGLLVLNNLILLLDICYLSRKCEYEADDIAARELNNPDGGIVFFERLIKEVRDPESRFAIKRIFSRLYKKLFSTHPEFEERIDHMRNIIASTRSQGLTA